MRCVHAGNRQALTRLRDAQYDGDADASRAALLALCAPDALFRLSWPFDEMVGPESFYDQALTVLSRAWPDVERRDWIVVGGEDAGGSDWVGCGGHFLGTFTAPLLDIPPTGHLTHMRFHEFYRFFEGKIVEYQAIWDIPEVMMQARAWPMAPSLGREICIPGPATKDGLSRCERDPALSASNCELVRTMLEHMKRHPSQGGAEVMEMDRFWHPKMNWYGPAGIGSCRGISGFRNWHQIPFLKAMPDRGQKIDEASFHFFADNAYVGVTGWPNMIQTLTDDGWMGIAPSGKEFTMRSLDFWRIEKGKIRENWVMVDLLDAYRQLGVDVLARLREFNKASPPFALNEGCKSA